MKVESYLRCSVLISVELLKKCVGLSFASIAFDSETSPLSLRSGVSCVNCYLSAVEWYWLFSGWPNMLTS